MKLLLLNANTTAEVTARMVASLAPRCPQDVQMVGITAPFGSPYVSTRGAVAVASHAALEAVRTAVAQAERDGQGRYDGCFYACFGEPGIEAIRSETKLPVAGMAEGSVLTALQLGERFSILTMGEAWPGMLREQLRRLGLIDRCAGIGVVRGDGLSLSRDHARGLPAVAEAARAAIERDQPDVLIVAGAALAGYAALLAHDVAIPVIDSLEAGFEQALALARLRCRTPTA